jgi:phage terminase large subunit-like protein
MHANVSLAASLASLPPEQRMAVLSDLTSAEAARLEYDWRFWARPNQIQPDGDWLTWLISAGRGFGKTRTGAETVREWAETGRYGRIALVAETAADARDVLVEGESGILAISPSWFKPFYEPSKRRLTWPNGAVGTLYNGTEPDQLRGPQHDAAWVDELAKYPDPQSCWDQLQFGLRLGTNPRQIVTTTPRPIPLIRSLLRDARTVVTRGRTMDNAANLAPSFVRTITERYAGTRLGRQELEAEMLDDVPGALWTRAMIDDAVPTGPIPAMARVVVAIDPSGTDGSENGDEIGIVVAGRGTDGRGYILADRSCRLSPDGWGRMAVAAYHEFHADRIVAERNFGGAMVQHVILTADRRAAYSEVTASRGKVIRAEPISALYEQKRITHVEPMHDLETQMVHMTQGGYLGEGSPDRVDAMVWALSELMLQPVATSSVTSLRM